MDPSLIDVVKLQQTFLRIHDDEDFFIHRDYVISFCIVFLKNTNFDVTWEQLKSRTLEKPTIKCNFLYKHSKIYRLLCIIQDAQRLIETLGDVPDCRDNRSRWQRFWGHSLLPFWSILKLKFSQRAHWFNDLQC